MTEIERGAQLLDVVYGPKWFRTETVSLAEVQRQTVDMSFILNRLEGYEQHPGYVSGAFAAVTRKAREKGVEFANGDTTGIIGDNAPEIWGEKFGFFRGAQSEPEFGVAWAKEIRTRRYNRPAKRRVSARTARTNRTAGKAVSISV